MVNLKIIFILLMAILFGCNEKNSSILPKGDLNYLEKYHCWPYDVNVYSVNNVKIDSLFYAYPLKSFFGDNPKYEVTNWKKYSEIDTTIWYGMDKTLEQCDDNIELYNQRLKGGDIYYAGSYHYFKNQKGEQRRRYEKILFLDLVNKRLHIFKDINKVY